VIDLSDRAIVMTGGSSGIGLACAELALELGARVTIADVRPCELAGAEYVHCDARDPGDVERALPGRLDGLVTTVGGAELGSIEELTLERWNEQLAFNLTSAYVPARAALLAMRDRGGAIVTVSSGYADLPGPDRAAYTAAKAGVIAFTRSLAAAGAPHRVRANCVAPGPTDTPRFRAMNGGDEGVERVRAAMPMGEIPVPRDCAAMICFLLSDAARQVTGQTIHVNGGVHMP
jgi:NAD(P)-dependent dehydrogenase (short-subunit alcohol dehydrogenase family)